MQNTGNSSTQFPNNFLRNSTQNFATRIMDQENGVSSHVFCGYALDTLHRVHNVPAARNEANFPHQPSVKTSFSIDSLLGLKDTTQNKHRLSPIHAAMNWNHRQYSQPHIYPSHNHNHEEGLKGKSPLRYTPYKRERKTTAIVDASESKDGNRNGKAKRVRTIFTPEQLEKLESEFERQQYMVGTERSYLAESLDLTEAQVKVWFQNRRIKWRKVHLEMAQERLRAIQSQETREGFDESSESSEDGSSMNRNISVPIKSMESREGTNNIDMVKGSMALVPQQPRTQLDMDDWLLKTFGKMHSVPRWIGENWNSGSDGDSE